MYLLCVPLLYMLALCALALPMLALRVPAVCARAVRARAVRAALCAFVLGVWCACAVLAANALARLTNPAPHRDRGH